MKAMISTKPFRYLTVMDGHLSEVTSIKWHPVADRWISGGDDGQIRYMLKNLIGTVCYGCRWLNVQVVMGHGCKS